VAAMPETSPLESLNTTPRRTLSPLLLAGLAIVLVAVGFFYFTTGGERKPGVSSSAARLPFGQEEKAYAQNIDIENVTMSRIENYIHQEVITLSAEAVNGGNRSLAALEVTIEFFDEADQIALRDTHSVLDAGAPRLAPGERRTFEVSFEHIPASWNHQQPVVRVTGMRFGSMK
jgi:Protein of unknown function (DUF3426)